MAATNSYADLLPSPDLGDGHWVKAVLAYNRLTACANELATVEADTATWRKQMDESESVWQHDLDLMIGQRDRGLTGWDKRKDSKLAALQSKLSAESHATREEFYKTLRRKEVLRYRARLIAYRLELNRLLGLPDDAQYVIIPE